MRQRLRYCFYPWLLACTGVGTQAQSVAPATISMSDRAIPLVADTSRQVLLASGKIKSATFWELPPGNGYALYFIAPPGSQRQLISIRLYFASFRERIAKGQVRLRVASVATAGGPANDNLLAKEVLITEQTLQYLTEPLTLTWPAERITVPASGFFIVLEGVGNAADEYVITSPHIVLAGAGNSTIGRRSQPNATPRLLSTWSIPHLFSAKLTTVPVGLWGHEGEAPEWQHFSSSKQVPMLEIGFK
jgi:hypothetical protein